MFDCRSPLQEEVDAIMAKAEAGGALGVGTERYATGQPVDALPEGAALRPVRVRYARWVTRRGVAAEMPAVSVTTC